MSIHFPEFPPAVLLVGISKATWALVPSAMAWIMATERRMLPAHCFQVFSKTSEPAVAPANLPPPPRQCRCRETSPQPLR